MKVLLIGGSGQLGSEICKRWTSDDIVAPPHSELDLEDAFALKDAVDDVCPELVVNCAAFHNVDICERQSDHAFEANALAVDRVAALCEKRDTAFLTISTDYVFDGGATCRTRKRTALARSPSTAHRSLPANSSCCGAQQRRSSCEPAVCTACTHRRAEGTFIDRIIAQARSGETPRVVSDVVASPTFAGDLATRYAQLVETGASGLYHACNAGPVSWYDFARAALDLAGIAAADRADPGCTVEGAGAAPGIFGARQYQARRPRNRDAVVA